MRGAFAAVLTALATAAPAWAQDRVALSRSWSSTDTYRARPAWFICDGITPPPGGGPLQVNVVEAHDATPPFTWVRTWDKRDGREEAGDVRIGRADPGAGQIYYPIDGGGPDRRLHEVNPGMVADPPGALTPPFMEIRINHAGGRCRWVPGTRLLAVTRRRSVMVVQDARGRLTYQSFDDDKPGALIDRPPGQTSTPSLTLTGISETPLRAGARFTVANGSFTYRIDAPNMAGPSGTLEVFRAGRRVLREPLLAYTYAPNPRASGDR